MCQQLLDSPLTNTHLEHRLAIETDAETAAKEKAFVSARDKFAQVEPYGKYAPDYVESRRRLRQEKRQLDMDPHVSAFRVSERELQNVLDKVTYSIAQSVSSEIKIDAGNPFFEFAQKGCGGSCQIG